MYKFSILVFIFMLSGPLHAQDVVMNINMADTAQKEKGPNLKFFRQNWVQFSLFVPYENNPRQQFPASYHLAFGHRLKYKLNATFSWGWGFAFHFNHYRLDSVFVIPRYATEDIRKEKFLQRQLTGEWFFRTNFGKRGNIIGKFLDIGAEGGWNGYNTFRYLINEKDAQGNNIARTSINVRRFGGAIPYYYGVVARLGINKFMISGELRLSEMFKGSRNLPELSPLRVGLQFGL